MCSTTYCSITTKLCSSFVITITKRYLFLQRTVAVGTDGEVAILQALEDGDTVYLRCFIHMRDCIQRKLKESSILKQDIEQDIFGLQRGKEYIKGLVDLATPEEFDRQLAVAKIR